MPVNQAKLQKLQQQGDKARIGGKVSWLNFILMWVAIDVYSYFITEGICKKKEESSP